MLTYDTGVAWLAPIAVAVPIAGAAVLLAGGPRFPRALTDGLATACAGAVTGLVAVVLAATTAGRVVAWSGGWQPRHGIEVGIDLEADPIGAGLATLAAGLTVLVLVFAWRFLEDVDAHFQALVLLFLGGAIGFSLTGDLFDLFVFFELMGAASYGLTSLAVEDPGALQGGLNFAIVNSLAAYLSFAGIGLLYARTGDLGLSGIGQQLAGRRADALVVAAFVLVLLGFLVKAAVVPFHFWLADAQAVAPPSVGVLVSAVMVPLGVYAVFRTTWIVFLPSIPAGDLRRVYLLLGVLTAAVGAAMCLGQHHVKRLLAFAAVAETGLLLCTSGLLDRPATAAGALSVLGQVTDLAAAILLAGLLRYRYGTVDERKLHGRGRRARLMPWLWVATGLAMAGLPPFGVGLGHGAAEAAAIKEGDGFLVPVFLLVPACLGGAILRVAGSTFFGLGRPAASGGDEAGNGAEEPAGGKDEELEGGGPLPRVPLPMLLPILVLLLGCLGEGLAPGLRAAAAHAAAFFTEPAGYRAAALDHRGVPTPAPRPGNWTAIGLGLGAAAGALAVAVAAAGLYRHRLDARRAATLPLSPLSFGRRVLQALRLVHSGHVGDYVAWLMTGAALMAALVGLPLLRP